MGLERIRYGQREMTDDKEKFSGLDDKKQVFGTKISFGTTSAIITNLGLMTGLDRWDHPQTMIIGGILAIALADNLSDSLGIHFYQESECINHKKAWLSTFTNFIARLFVSLTFIVFVVALPIKLAVMCSIAWGLFLLCVMSYMIAKARRVNPYLAMLEHMSIAVFVILVCRFASVWLNHLF
jgi:VIT1/CCC1 family predicted Fe2+/Mn2+ transporter